MDAATQLLAKLKARPEVASVTSYYSTHSASLVSRDGHETFAVVQLTAKDEATKEKDFKTIQPLITSPTFETKVGGNVAVNVAINKQVSSDLERAELITFPIVAILLLIVFGSLVAASLPLLIGGVAIMGAFAILRAMAGWTDVSVYAVNVVTMLGLGLAIDYALFIVTRFREELGNNNGEVKGAIERTMSTAGRTIMFSGLTISTSLIGSVDFSGNVFTQHRHGGNSSHSDCNAGCANNPACTLSSAWPSCQRPFATTPVPASFIIATIWYIY